MPRDEELPLEFPLGGLDVTKEFQLQPPGTTPSAANVRVTDTIALRRRGGSRPGLVRYIDELVRGAPGNEIQHLNVIVDPTTAALTQNFDTPDDTWIEHPRFPGVYVPPGGGGNQPNPNADQPEQPPGEDITFYQTYGSEAEPFDGEHAYNFELNFDLEVQIGHTMIIGVLSVEASPGTAPGMEMTVTNDDGDPYTRVGSALGNGGYNRVTGDNNQELSLSLWYKRVAAEADKTIKITPSVDNQFVKFRMAEYDNVDTPSTLGDFSFDSDGGNNISLTTGQFDSGGEKYMTLAVYAIDRVGSSAGPTFTPDAAYTRRGTGGIGINLFFVDDVDTGLSLNHEVACTVSANCAFAGIGASFQPE